MLMKKFSNGNKFTEKLKTKYSNEKIVIICADIEDQIMGLDKMKEKLL